jgi:threonine dehydrogenase-like Zn-dependent dehydrogenase
MSETVSTLGDEPMRALWLEDGALSVREVPRPSPPEGEALVRVRLAGVCGTDLEQRQGYADFTGIPGHEFVGEIVAVEAPGSSDAAKQVGQRVVGDINAACRQCPTCRAGRPTHCPSRTVLGIVGRHGAFADFLTLPLANLHPVPPTVPDEVAVFTEPLAAALRVLEQMHVRPTHRVLVIGAGRLGQLLAQVLALTGCDLQVVARYPVQRRILSARAIPSLTLDPHSQSPSLPTGEMDLAVEATGSPDGFWLARRAVRPRGTVVLNSTFRGELALDLASLVVDEITLAASRCGPFPPALRLLAAGHVETAPLLEARYPLAEALAAFEHAARPGAFKVLLQP